MIDFKKKLEEKKAKAHEKLPIRPVVVGLDLSTTGTGMCALIQNEHRTKTFTRATAKTDWSEREMSRFVKGVREFVELFKPKLVAIEGYSHGSYNVAMLAELGGCVRVMLDEIDVPFIVLAPSTLKKFVCGDGKQAKGEGKGLMFLNVFKKWDASFTDNNQCDAYALARMARCVVSPSEWAEANNSMRSCFGKCGPSLLCRERYGKGLERVGWKPTEKKRKKGKK